MTEGAFFISPIPVETLERELRSRGDLSVVTLQGVVRPDRDGKEELDFVVYEADASRAAEDLNLLRGEIEAKWPGSALLFRHRLGAVSVGETSVFIAVTSPQRDDSLAACRYVMERLRGFGGLKKRDVFRDGTTRDSPIPHEALLLSDDAIDFPQS